MSRRDELVCQCGAKLPRPMPIRCPKCGVTLSRVRVHWWSYLTPCLVVGSLFAMLLAYVYWLSQS
jgi:hypothetical protein